ncbi:MAG: hypothetical protein HFE84_03965 [Lachnospiraceae bacterium]|nr:hypothetical protein [Lachnospiraceae bacterium]
MRERINRLARGIVDADPPKLFLSPKEAEETLGSNTLYKRELYLSSENNLHIKGLAYSSHSRVRIINGAFGGLRNHITYEVDTSWCENGDTIKGTILLVTNGGELLVPFLFHVETTASVKVMTTLTTVESFVELAKKDMDMALRLMEYQDFSEAAFMQDMHVRTVYEGLKGHGNRQNALEEFFLALGAKEPIELTVSSARKFYENPSGVLADKVVLRKNTWGYLYLEVRADGEFIELSKKTVTQADFTDDRFELRFKIHPERMHKGKNLGAIRLLAAHGETMIRIEAMGDTTVDITGRENEISKSGICRYLKLRESYENGSCTDGNMVEKLQKELDIIRATRGNSLLLSLLQAENELEAGHPEQAALCLDECKSEALATREQNGTIYCYYQYLQYLVNPDPDKKDVVLRLLRRKLDSRKGRFYLHMLLLKLDPELYGDEEGLYTSLREQYENGCTSPFLYGRACRILNDTPTLLRVMDEFSLQVLYYSAKHGLAKEELALRAADLAGGSKFYHRLYYRALSRLYEQFPKTELLNAVCCLLIKGNLRNEEAFAWYEKGVKAEISLTRLYEYYLYSLPEAFDRVMPRQVLLYFSYENSHLDRKSRSVLYKNVLASLKPEDSLYQTYEREMEKFAMEQLFESRINSRLAVIYKHMIYRDVIDREVAKVLPAVLRSNRIVCKDAAMKYVVVCNEFLTGEDAYPLNDGVAYVPLFFDDCVLLFQDMYGNRYLDVACTKEPVLDEKELEEKCFEVFPDHPMLKMRECLRIMEKTELTAEETGRLERALDELPVKPLYQQKMLTKIISYYKSRIESEDGIMPGRGGTYLLRLDKKNLTRGERAGVCETLISQNYFTEAYAMIRQFGEDGVRLKPLARLCSKVILQRMFAEDALLLHMAHRVFAAGKGDSVILDYLCEHYNGGSDEMYRILVQAVREHVETYDMEERLLGQLLFTGSGRRLDTVFDFYVNRKRTSEMIVKAYFTIKSVEYFLRDIVPGDRVFAYLEGAVNSSTELWKVPEIYLLAVARYYSELSSLNGEQQALCKRIMAQLLNEGMIFSWFKKLSKYVELSGDILDKEIIEYHGKADVRPILKVRVLPDEEEFHEEELRPVYKGIYVRQKVLFEGEIMEYEVYEEENGSPVKKAGGEIACAEVPAGDKGNRFSCLNSMSMYISLKDDEKLKDAMLKYVTDDRKVERLFPLA